jgi:hypothetical protein
MKALFTVADSLEDDDEKSYVPNHQSENEKSVVVSGKEPDAQLPVALDENSESTSSDEDEFTQDSSAFGEDDDRVEETVNESSPFNIMSFFGVDFQNQHMVGEVLDDLLWGDFVSSGQGSSRRTRYTNAKARTSKQGRTNSVGKSRKIALKVKDYSCPPKRLEPIQESTGAAQPSKSRWRTQLSATDEWENEEDDEDESSSSSEEFPSYLPTSITVKKKGSKRSDLERKLSPTSFPRDISSHYKQHQPQLVETESRLGFEMETLPRRTKLV